MTFKPLHPCRYNGCMELVSTTYCAEHQKLKDADVKRKTGAFDKRRGTSSQRGYTSKWRVASKAFLRANPLCVDCMKDEKLVPAAEVDHIMPHRGDKKLFWDKTNWQGLCKRHHSQKTMRGE